MHTHVVKQKRNRTKHTSKSTEHVWRTQHTWNNNHFWQVIVFMSLYISLFIWCIQFHIILFINLCFSCIWCIDFLVSLHIHFVLGFPVFCLRILCFIYCLISYTLHSLCDSYDDWKQVTYKRSSISIEICVRIFILIQVHVSRKNSCINYISMHTYE